MIKHDSGLSFIEFLLAALFITVLGFVLIPRFFTSSDTSRYSAHLKEVKHINSQLEAYYFKHSSYPSSMDETSWKGKNGEPATVFFPFGVPRISVYGKEWEIINGRVYADKNQIFPSKKSKKHVLHVQNRLIIEDTIKRYYLTYNVFPKGMTNSDWIGPFGDSFRVFFPEGVPNTCNQGATWNISNGEIELSGHELHE